MKKSFIKKIKENIIKFLEEDEEEDKEEEINVKSLIIIFLIGFVIIISIYVYTNKDFGFMKSNFDEIENTEQEDNGEINEIENTEQEDNREINEIENTEQEDNREIIQFKGYFMEKEVLENLDLSDDVKYWSNYKETKEDNNHVANITLNRDYYRSKPPSLDIYCSAPSESSCSIYYDTKPNSINTDDPYSVESDIWIGIKTKTKLKFTYWYKGGGHTIKFLKLDKYGEFNNLKVLSFNDSEKWRKKEIIVSIPDYIKAYGIEIVTGHKCNLLIDDVQLSIL